MSLFELGREKTGGRRKGSRNRISTALLEALAEDFEQFGKEAIKITRLERPGEYLKICAGLVPQAFENDAPLQVAVSQIVRTIVDPRDNAVRLPRTNLLADEAIE